MLNKISNPIKFYTVHLEEGDMYKILSEMEDVLKIDIPTVEYKNFAYIHKRDVEILSDEEYMIEVL